MYHYQESTIMFTICAPHNMHVTMSIRVKNLVEHLVADNKGIRDKYLK